MNFVSARPIDHRHSRRHAEECHFRCLIHLQGCRVSISPGNGARLADSLTSPSSRHLRDVKTPCADSDIGPAALYRQYYRSQPCREAPAGDGACKTSETRLAQTRRYLVADRPPAARPLPRPSLSSATKGGTSWSHWRVRGESASARSAACWARCSFGKFRVLCPVSPALASNALVGPGFACRYGLWKDCSS